MEGQGLQRLSVQPSVPANETVRAMSYRQRCRTWENRMKEQDPMGRYYPNIVEISDISA